MNPIRILLVEDHTLVRETIADFLGREPDLAVVGQAGDGEEGVRLAKKLKPDVVIIDVSMPKLNGIEATKKIKESRPRTTVLALSAYDYDQYIFALLDAGCAGYLLKDVSGQELVGAIRAVNRGDSVLHPSVARKVVQRCRTLRGKPQDRARATPRYCGNRAFNAARPVRWNDSLAEASRLHSEDMARYNYFSHNGRDGSDPAQRVERAGYRYRATGENIAAGQMKPEDAVAGWIKSPQHCANLMNPAYTEMGAAFSVNARSDMGVYWTQAFGSRR